jgi:succinoglycan biosynthesis transport protein ExoP
MDDEIKTAPNEISVRDYADMFRRRRAIIIQTFVVVFVVGLVVTFMTKPLYRTGSRILVEGKSVYVTQFDPGNPLGNLFTADAGHEVETQLEVLQGDKVLADAYRVADVAPGTVALQAKEYGTTDIIDITAESNNRQSAQKLANALPGVYLNYVTGNRRTEIVNALQFAQLRLTEENGELRKSEQALQHFREQSHVTNVETERTQRITDKVTAEAEVRKLEASVAGLQARLSALQATRKTLVPSLVVPTSTTNLQIAVVNEQIAVLRTERAKLALLFKPASLEMQKVDAQIGELRRRLTSMPAMVTTVTRTVNPHVSVMDETIAQVNTDLLEARSQLTGTQAQANGSSKGLDRYGMLERDQARLQREIARHEGSLALLTKSVDDLSLREKATHDPVVVISPAGVATQIAPQRLNNLMVATLLGLVLGLCFALLQEFLDDRINSPEEAKRIFGVPALGFIPLIEKEDARLLSTLRGGTLLETYRVLRSNVSFSAVDAPIRSIMVTSTVPGEGKSMTTYNLAVAMALEGRNVILVDADLRRPTIHKKAQVERGPGLVNVLVGHMDLRDALQNTDIPNLRILTAGPLPPNPAEILSSNSMKRIHAELKELADIVLYDTPPCLATADAQLLSADVDGVLYVANFGETKRSTMRRAADLLKQAHARVLGVVFNKIDLTGNRDDYYYGYYRYYNYYSEAGETTLPAGGKMQRPTYREFDALTKKNGANGHVPTGVAAGEEGEKQA